MWKKLQEKCNRLRLLDKKLYLVTNSDGFANEDEFLDAVASALAGGVDVVQLREKNMPVNKVIELGGKVKQLCAQFNALFIVNDRVDIAYILESDGVHLGQEDIPPLNNDGCGGLHYARQILGQNAIVGVSTHAPEQALKAVEMGADYIGAGPVFTTPTKPGRASVGLEYIRWVSENIDIPAFAIGGIDLANVGEVIDAGAQKKNLGIAVVRAIINSKNPGKSAGEFLKKLPAHT